MNTIIHTTKQATGLTGLTVAKNPVHTLNVLYSKILRALEKMPKDAAYTKYTEQIITSKLAIVKSAQTVDEIEEKINCGQVEEVIVQAENELSLVRTLAKCNPWDRPIEGAPADQWIWPPAKLQKRD